jgi:uncharacterized protein (DUF433 family)
VAVNMWVILPYVRSRRHPCYSCLNMTSFERITFDPQILSGRACIRGMRIPVSLIVNLVANGMSAVEILAEYPDLEKDDIREALQYAAALTQDEIHFVGR